jgi:hypothetical protein
MASRDDTRTIKYVGVAGVAAWFGNEPETVSKWLSRYDDWPTPDAEISPGRNGVPDCGWLPERKADWLAWKASLPGQGAPGLPKPRKMGP